MPAPIVAVVAKAAQPLITTAIVELIALIGKLISQARRTEEWTPDQEKTVADAWEEAYKAPHWQKNKAKKL